MKQLYLLFLLAVTALGILPSAAQTQRDPTFTPQVLWQPASVAQALQLGNGSRVLVGYFLRINGVNSPTTCVRFTPSGQVDTGFSTQIASFNSQVLAVAEVPGNKLLVVIRDSVSLGGQYRKGLIRLLADGSYDATFTSLPGFSYYNSYPIAVQPDGRIVLGGDLAVAAQRTLVKLPVVRLLATGQLDTSFSAMVGPTFTGTGLSTVSTIRLQADGKILLAGTFYANSTLPSRQLLRLQSTGTPDASFVVFNNGKAKTMELQPDGKLLVAFKSSSGQQQTLLTRLLPDGSTDFTFTAPALFVSGIYSSNNTVIQVQADGRILVAGATADYDSYLPPYADVANQFVSRLLANGQPDPSWQPSIAGNDYQVQVQSLQLLPGGQVLIGSSPHVYGAATAVPVAVGVLDATGQYVSGFAPLLQNPGDVYALTTQSDGKILVAGSFTEINGQPARNLARLLPTGTLDAAFMTNALVAGGTQTVQQVAVQPDGRIVIAGGFASVDGLPRPCVARLLPTGAPDVSFIPGLAPTSNLHNGFVRHMVLQADGKVLVSGRLRLAGSNQTQLLVRLTTAGAADNGFQSPSPISFWSGYDMPIAVRTNGSVLTANVSFSNGNLEDVTQLLPTGALDPAFITQATNSSSSIYVNDMLLYPDGRLLIAGDFSRFGNKATHNVARILPTGAIDVSFTSAVNDIPILCVALQPNNRILAASSNTYYNTPAAGPIARLQPTGSIDASFNRSVLPINQNGVYTLNIQPDGGILAGGYFAPLTAGQPFAHIIRLLDANVLRVTSQQTAANTVAYPIPAHGQLHLRLDAAAKPQTVALLDAFGRSVLTQTVAQPDMELSTAALASGVYILRVDYATGWVTRRVVIE